MSIFISIASYCDPVLPFTLRRAVQRARWPERLHFAVIDQSPLDQPALDEAPLAPARVSVVRIDPLQARGPCWARALAMSLYSGEHWFFQIDSHTDFDPYWDERLIAQAMALHAIKPAFVISAYPRAFDLVDGEPVHQNVTTNMMANVVKPDSTFDPDHPVLLFRAKRFQSDQPVRGFHVGGNCLFAPASFVKYFPYDPFLYFHGEEQALAARLYTHGWDIFHTPDLPVYHLYRTEDSKAPPRPLHWDEDQDARRKQTWWPLEMRSRARAKALLELRQDLGVYSLGNVRSLEDYARFSGIDYAARTLSPLAYEGPWQTATP